LPQPWCFLVTYPAFLIGRLGRSSLGYSGSRTSISNQELHGTYGSRQGMSYGGGEYCGTYILKCYLKHQLLSAYIFIVCCMSGSFGGSDGGMYTSSYGGDYESRGSDVMFLVFLNWN